MGFGFGAELNGLLEMLGLQRVVGRGRMLLHRRQRRWAEHAVMLGSAGRRNPLLKRLYCYEKKVVRLWQSENKK